MCRKYLWCYIFILTLLDISLNTKLTAQGESHGVSIHDSLVEGITFQEWDKESGVDIESVSVDALEGVLVSPGALVFGRARLAAPHARVVTVTNTANTTLHLASVAGTTPDFHASFFESKTLQPQGNTTFTVVYLGRREGPVSAHLYIHTSFGVHKFPVSAIGVASEYDVWPLVGVRVPLNASVEADLRLYNPTDATVQVSEVYSTGAWLGLRLPGGGQHAPRELWAVPPRTSRTLVTLRLAHAAHRALADHQRPLTAYVRVRADIPGGGLVVAVEARGEPAGEHARPLHVRLRPRGSGDAQYTVELEAANSGAAGVSLEGAVSARCSRAAPPPCAAPPAPGDAPRANGGTATGAHLTMLRSHLEPYEEFTRVAQLTLDYAELWSQLSQSSRAKAATPPASGEAQPEEAWCSGCVRLGRALVPFSVQLLPGALRFTPEQIDVITAEDDVTREREVRAHNAFLQEMHVLAVTVPEEVKQYFHVVEHSPLRLAPGAAAPLLRLAAREPAPPPAASLAAALAVHTDLAIYTLPLHMYSGKLIFEWDWANATSSHVELGTVGASWTRRVGVRVRNPAAGATLCVSALEASLAGAAASLALAEPRRRCVPPGDWLRAWLTVVAPAAEGSLQGEALLSTAHATTRASLAMRVRAGALRVLPLVVPPAAPYANSWADVEVESSMAVRMRVTGVDQPPPADPALAFVWAGPGLGLVSPGNHVAARLLLAPEHLCRPHCYTGLELDSTEGAAWASRGAPYAKAAHREDVALLQRRLAMYRALPAAGNFTLYLHTAEVLQLAAHGSWEATWPRLTVRGAGGPVRAGVGHSAPLLLTVRSPASVPLLLHALLPPDAEPPHPALPPQAGGDAGYCVSDECTWSSSPWRLGGWRVLRGTAVVWNETSSSPGSALPALLLAPHTELELSLEFTPEDAGAFTAYLYLRNNLTILEGVQLFGEGEYPSFEIAGRRPGSAAPFVFEVKSCAWGGAGAVVRRVLARNAGRVRAALAGWRVARGGCAARGFRVSPCAPLALAPNASAPLHLAFSPDYSLARVSASLQLQTDLGPVEYMLLATVPAKILAKCAAKTPRPPWDGMMRGVCSLIAFAAFALVLGAGALDAERLLRRARASRATAQAPRTAPLDLRRLAAEGPPPAPAPRAPARRRRSARRVLPPLDPHAERRAFERWRAGVMRRDDDSSRSSEDVDLDLDDAPPVSSLERSFSRPPDETFDDRPSDCRTGPSADAEDDEPPKEDESPAIDEEPISTGSDASTPIEDRDDADEPYGGDVEPDPRDDSPTDGQQVAPVTKPIVRPIPRSPPVETVPRSTRPRRETSDTQRRSERPRLTETGERRSTPARHHMRKERASKRRGERTQPSPPPRSPARPGTAGADTPEARGGVRWGATWSSVVAARAAAPLAPIGSDVRRREPERPADNSLFYFNGTSDTAPRPEPEFAWRPTVAAERPAFVPAARDYLEEPHSLGGPVNGVAGAGAVGAVGGGFSGSGLGGSAVWGGAWGAWGAGGLRPPPGFSPPEPPAQRSYDPFRSLASIWAPAPHDWRAASPRRERDDRA